MDRDLEFAKQLLDDYEKPLLRYVWQIVKDHDYAQDVVQEVFIKFLNTIPPPTSVRGFLFRIAHNLCCDYLRIGKRRKTDLCENDDFRVIHSKEKSPMEILKIEEECSVMNEVLETLDEKKKTIVLLKIEHGMSYQQIGEIVGMTPTNVGATLCQTLKKLRQDFNVRMTLGGE